MMRNLSKILVFCACTAVLPAAMAANSVQQELNRSAHPDVTGQQKYRTIADEAGGALKMNMANCHVQPAKDRRDCEKAARDEFNHEMARAREALKNPSISTSPEIASGGIKETVTPIKP
ncbi:MAG: hypothetical protein OJF60_002003 [Burkholderiaceae bacterium]|jgi:hypothetical protein|nr:MAG: hypothetical protein OJF60_002003 [Burkholderiaceae bacterium]